MIKKYCWMIATLLLPYSYANAAELFTITIESKGQSYTESFNDAEESLREFDTDSFEQSFQGDFDANIDPVRGILNYRGLSMNVEFIQNSTELVLNVPSLGINETFQGATREDSSDELVEYLKSQGGSVLNQINKKLAETSSVDPVAGNPNSLMHMMVSTLHNRSMASSNLLKYREGDTDNKLDLGIRFGRFRMDGNDVETIHLPLGYTVNFDKRPGHQLHFWLPVSYSRVNNGAETYTIGGGVGYTYPITRNLSVTPGISFGAVGSVDLGSVAAIRTISNTTTYDFKLFDHQFRYGNTLAHIETMELKLDDYAIDPDLSNTVMVNGINWKTALIKSFETEVFFNDTRFFGDRLYSERTNEIGLAVSSTNIASQLVDINLNLGLSYVFTDRDDISGFRFNFGSQF